jgi:sugar transferase (PEP-CTERM system associated)
MVAREDSVEGRLPRTSTKRAEPDTMPKPDMRRAGPPPGPRERTLVRVVRYFVRAPLVLLAVLELATLMVVPSLARLFVTGGTWEAPWLPSVAYAFVHLVALTSMGLYSRRQRARLIEIMLRVAAAIALGAAGVVVISFLLPVLQLDRWVLLACAPVAFIALGLLRFAFESLVDEDIFKRRVLVYGAGRRAMSVTQLRRRSDTRGFRVCGYVAGDVDRPVVPDDKLVAPQEPLIEYCRKEEIDEIVVAMDDRRRAFPVHELLECRLAGIVVTDLVDFLEAETGKVRLDVLNPSWFIFAPGFSRHPLRQLSERLLDLSACLTILFFAWPLMLLAALAIKLEEGWGAPVFYSQVRVGLEGRHFRVMKFRSMRLDAEKAGQAIWAQKRDPRVTRVGSFIRKTRIDELPQLINVLRGDMSFVGPRPERPEFVAQFEQTVPYYRERHTVKPGITGWAQLCYPYGASEDDAREKLQYDLYYVKNHSLLFDLMILVQTAEVVLWGKGAR